MSKKCSKQFLAIAIFLVVSSSCSTTNTSLGAAPSPTVQVVTPAATPTEPPPVDNLTVLRDIVVPEKNEIELANRFLNIDEVPETLPAPEEYYQVGDRRLFWISDTDSD